MGPVNDTMAVVDNHARVIELKGLRVVDASAFPELPPGHPQATVNKFYINSPRWRRRADIIQMRWRRRWLAISGANAEATDLLRCESLKPRKSVGGRAAYTLVLVSGEHVRGMVDG